MPAIWKLTRNLDTQYERECTAARPCTPPESIGTKEPIQRKWNGHASENPNLNKHISSCKWGRGYRGGMRRPYRGQRQRLYGGFTKQGVQRGGRGGENTDVGDRLYKTRVYRGGRCGDNTARIQRAETEAIQNKGYREVRRQYRGVQY